MLSTLISPMFVYRLSAKTDISFLLGYAQIGQSMLPGLIRLFDGIGRKKGKHRSVINPVRTRIQQFLSCSSGQ